MITDYDEYVMDDDNGFVLSYDPEDWNDLPSIDFTRAIWGIPGKPLAKIPEPHLRAIRGFLMKEYDPEAYEGTYLWDTLNKLIAQSAQEDFK